MEKNRRIKTLITALIPPVIISFFLVIYHYKYFLQGLVPFPGDMLLGAYYPYLDTRWSGLATSVPIKNPLITDVFSQFALWKILIAESFKQLQLPLWNPFSYAGYPLLATFHSAVFNPFNLLLVLLNRVDGWALMVISQILFSAFTYYYFLRQLKTSRPAAVLGSITYAFSPFLATWSQFVTAGFAMVWLPLILAVINRYYTTLRPKELLPLPLLTLLLVVSGHFQALTLGLIFTAAYALYLYYGQPRLTLSALIRPAFMLGLGLLLGSVQLIPTLEMMGLSIRFTEGYIAEYNFGLVPLTHLVTLFAPDFFGNPATFNFWGFFNYHETLIYGGVVPLLALVASIFLFRHLSRGQRFFLISALVSLVFIVDNPLSRAVYLFRLPLLSTSAAGRIALFFILSISALTAFWFDRLPKLNFSGLIRSVWSVPVQALVLLILTYLISRFYSSQPAPPLESQTQVMIAFRNLIFPGLLLGASLTVLILGLKFKIFRYLLILITFVDLFRFGHKYLPFTPRQYFFPDTGLTRFLQDQPGVFRVERETGPLLPPNTWTAYSLPSLSGYDPMALKSYSHYFSQTVNGHSQPGTSRYSEITSFDSPTLGRLNVKYLLALKRDQLDKFSPDGQKINYKIGSGWKQVYGQGTVVVLENPDFKPRSRILDSSGQDIGQTEIVKYSPQEVIISYQTPQNGKLLLTDTYYPGWQAYVNGHQVKIIPDSVFRSVPLPSGQGTVRFLFRPASFYAGLAMFGLSAVFYLIIALVIYRHKP